MLHLPCPRRICWCYAVGLTLQVNLKFKANFPIACLFNFIEYKLTNIQSNIYIQLRAVLKRTRHKLDVKSIAWCLFINLEIFLQESCVHGSIGVYFADVLKKRTCSNTQTKTAGLYLIQG